MLLVFFIALSVDKVIIFLGGITVYNTDTGSMRLSPFVSFLCDGNLFLKEKCNTLVMKILLTLCRGSPPSLTNRKLL